MNWIKVSDALPDNTRPVLVTVNCLEGKVWLLAGG